MTSATVVSCSTETMLMAIEVGETKWDLGFCRGEKKRRRTLEAWDQAGLREEVVRAKKRLGFGRSAPVICCYEAGRVGFSLHRFLLSEGLDSRIMESSSIEVTRQARRSKTDRLDLWKMLGLMRRKYFQGERRSFREVVAPSRESEARMRVHRERERLVKERTAHRARIRSLLSLHGIRIRSLNGLQPSRLRDWEGRALAPEYRTEMERELGRLQLTEEQIAGLEKEQQEGLATPRTRGDVIAKKLLGLRGVGPQSAWTLSYECFVWRTFRNRKQVGSMSGLVDCPYDSGTVRRQQGISKAGNRRIRWVMVELAWSWVRYEPDSALSQWWRERFGKGSKRQRRIGIVALARKLLIALWRYVEFDELPEGARLKATPGMSWEEARDTLAAEEQAAASD